MTRVLFIGNFLPRSSGSLQVSEGIADLLEAEGHASVIKASHFQNRFLRFVDILLRVTVGRYLVLHVDVFSGNSFLFARVAAVIGKLRSKRVVLTLHGGALHAYYPGREDSFRKMFTGAYVQTPSTFLKNFFEKAGFQITYCPNPLAIEKFPYNRDAVKPFSLLWVRAFTPIYNPHIPVLVLEKVMHRFPDVTLTMAGPDKGLMEEVRRHIDSVGLMDRVKIIGSVKNDELFTCYQSHAVYLNTTSYESFGVAVAEAACCGIPVVSFRVGEIPYLWEDEQTILLADPLDAAGMARQVERFFTDAVLSRQISVQARRRAEEFSWEAIKAHWIRLLNDRLSG